MITKRAWSLPNFEFPSCSRETSDFCPHVPLDFVTECRDICSFDSGAAPLPKQTNRSRRKRWIPLEKSVVRVLLRIWLRKFVGKIVFAKRLVPVLIWRLVGAGGASVWRIVLRLTYLSYRSCTIHRNAVCMWACTCNCVGVSVSRKKNFPISDAHFGERSCSNPPPSSACWFSPTVSFGERVVQGRSPTTRRTPMTNRSIGSIKTIIVGCVNEVYALVQL